MVSKSPHIRELPEYRRAVAEWDEIIRTMAKNISSMDDTSSYTRGLIAESYELIRKMDRLLARE